MAASSLHNRFLHASSALLLLLLSLSPQPSLAQQPSFRPKSLILSVTKDTATRQYTTTLLHRTPPVPLTLLLHLGGDSLWVNCDQPYLSSTYRPARCGSALCSLAASTACGDCFSTPRPTPGCNNNTCGIFPYNPITSTSTSGELATDLISLNSTDGSNPGRSVSVPRFLFACAPSFLTRGLAPPSAGVAGLGRTRIALPSQFAAAFSFPRKFAVCLGSSNGVVFFGNGPYNFLPNVQYTSQSLTYTRLLINPVSTAGASTAGEPSSEYFIPVTGINVGGKPVPNLNSTLLSIDAATGRGGTKISTVDPYTVLESSIYATVANAFVAAAGNVTRASAVAPFGFCFRTQGLTVTRLGYGVPTVELVMENGRVGLSLFGANTMVQVSDDVACLGFVDGGSSPRTAIVVGGYQLENNLVEFDLAGSRVGFSGLLFGRQTTCANFNFTTTTTAA
ncbi:unnamed protein product [Linum tenue]|uniref:Peptidase A1 domain-containing protein n=1 Tax=Linum tenue TaxID=586396 RepID=A0AAV0LGM7_9ROSI|nr:unnamed protein product [Linum tenue]